jgi:hypothetical protein
MNMEIYQKVMLIISALSYYTFGLCFLIFPKQWISRLSLAAIKSEGLTDIRAVYGGFELGIAVFLTIALFKPAYLQGALLASWLLLLGLGFSRLVGLVLDKPDGFLMPTLFIIEIVLFFFTFIAWKTTLNI